MGEDRASPIDRTLQSDITISIGLSSSSLVTCATGVNDGGFYSCTGGAKSGTFVQIRNTHNPAASFSLNAVRLYQGAIATGLATLEQESILQSTATMTSNNLLLNNPRSSAYDINALGQSSSSCSRYEQTFGANDIIHVVFRMPEEAFIDALLLIGSFSDVDIEQISDIRLAVTNSAAEPADDRSEDCGGSPYLSYPAADSGTADYANGVEVFCNQRGEFVHIIKEAVPAAIQTTLLNIPQNF